MFVHKEFDLMLLFYKQLLMTFWDYGRINVQLIAGMDGIRNNLVSLDC